MLNKLMQSASTLEDFQVSPETKQLRKTRNAEESSESHTSAKENTKEDVESSVMAWFKINGIEKGDPSTLKESTHHQKLKQLLIQSESKQVVFSSLLNRRLKPKLIVV